MTKSSFELDQYAARKRELDEAIERSRQHTRSAQEAAGKVTLTNAQQLEVAKRLFSRTLEQQGLRDALYSLLRKTDYRYATLFRFDGTLNRAMVHLDRQNLAAELPQAFPIAQSYCQYVKDAARPFVTAEAAQDEATVGHAKREVFQAYCGIPILAPDGTLAGSVCYYDEEPRQLDGMHAELLLFAATRIEASGLLNPG